MERLEIAGRQKGLSWKAVAQPHLPMALLAQRHRDWGCSLVLPPQTSNVAWEWSGPCQAPSSSPSSKMRTSADSCQAEGASLESCCSASSALGTARTEAQRLGLLASLDTSNINVAGEWGWSLPGSLKQPFFEHETSADSCQAEGASLESCCSASSSQGTARTEAQTLRLLTCLATSIFKHSLGMRRVPSRLAAAAVLRKCERLHIAGRQKGLAWKAIAHPHLPMALLAQRHRDWVFLLLLTPQT